MSIENDRTVRFGVVSREWIYGRQFRRSGRETRRSLRAGRPIARRHDDGACGPPGDSAGRRRSGRAEARRRGARRDARAEAVRPPAPLRSPGRRAGRRRLRRQVRLRLLCRGTVPRQHRRRLCRRQHRHHRGQGLRASHAGAGRRQSDRAPGRPHRPDRRRRLPDRGRRRASQGRHAGRDDRPVRPADRGSGRGHRPSRGPGGRLAGARALRPRPKSSAPPWNTTGRTSSPRPISAPSSGSSRPPPIAIARSPRWPPPRRTPLRRSPRSRARRPISMCSRRSATRPPASATN